MATRAPRRRTQEERRAETRAKLLRAAGRVFARRGYHDATLAEIVDAARLSKGALYHHFASKEDLFLALLSERLAERLAPRDDPAERDAPVSAVAGRFLAEVGRDPRWPPLFFEFVAYCARDPRLREEFARRFIRPARARAGDLAARRGRPAERSGRLDPEELLIVASALVNGLLLEQLFTPEDVPPDLATRAVAALVGSDG